MKSGMTRPAMKVVQELDARISMTKIAIIARRQRVEADAKNGNLRMIIRIIRIGLASECLMILKSKMTAVSELLVGKPVLANIGLGVSAVT